MAFLPSPCYRTHRYLQNAYNCTDTYKYASVCAYVYAYILYTHTPKKKKKTGTGHRPRKNEYINSPPHLSRRTCWFSGGSTSGISCDVFRFIRSCVICRCVYLFVYIFKPAWGPLQLSCLIYWDVYVRVHMYVYIVLYVNICESICEHIIS